MKETKSCPSLFLYQNIVPKHAIQNYFIEIVLNSIGNSFLFSEHDNEKSLTFFDVFSDKVSRHVKTAPQHS